MKLKELEGYLQDVDSFARPKIELEQYSTSAHIAARLVFTGESMFNDFSGRSVMDLGCGTGILSIAAALMDASHVVGLDVDDSALEAAAMNINQFEDLPVDLVQGDVSALVQETTSPMCLPVIDTVVTNPPFGTRKKGADAVFLQAACQVARGAVYSLHKSSTRAFVEQLALSQPRAVSAQVLAQLRYDLPASYAFHRKASKDIEVDLWRIQLAHPEG